MSFVEWVRAHKDELNVGLTLLTLIAVFWYTRAAYLAAEAPARPCVRFAARLPDYDAEAILRGEYFRLPTPYEGAIALINVGPGPALNLRFKFRRIEALASGGSITGGEPFNTGRTTNTLDPEESHFVALYESLSGKLYETAAIVRDRTFVSHAISRRSRWWRRAARAASDWWARRADRKQRAKRPPGLPAAQGPRGQA
ncbi:MAG: hypothetical protein ACRD1B_00040 [Thermoanaerobaculia bacterium]